MRKTIIILIIATLVSIAIRIPYLGNIEWAMAHTALTTQTLYTNGAHNYYFSPVYNTENPGDKWLEVFPSGIHDTQGNLYYISFPPLGFTILLTFHKIINVYPSIESIQIINLGLQILTASLLFYLVKITQNNSIEKKLLLPSLAYLFYLFLPATLIFHFEYFMPHLFLQPLWILQVILFVKITKQPQSKNLSTKTLLILLTFIMAYIDWLGFLTPIPLIALLWIKYKHKKLSLLLLFSLLLALITITVHYGSIQGIPNFITNIKEKLQIRSGFTESIGQTQRLNFTNPKSYFRILQAYVGGYFLAILFICIAKIYAYVTRTKSFISKEMNYFIIFGIPVLLHHILLFEYTAVHSFAVIITAPLFVLALTNQVANYLYLINKKILAKFIGIIVSVTFITISSNQYLLQAQNKKIIYQGYINLGKTINQTKNNQEVIFVCNQTYPEYGGMPILNYTINRIAIPCKDKPEALQLLEKTAERSKQIKNGVIYYYDLNYNVTDVERITVDKSL